MMYTNVYSGETTNLEADLYGHHQWLAHFTSSCPNQTLHSFMVKWVSTGYMYQVSD